MKKTTFLIAYPSELADSEYKEIYIDRENEKAKLVYAFRHFNEIEIEGEWKNIETFTVSDTCPVIYLIDTEYRIYVYELKNKKCKKITNIGGKGREAGKFENIKDCTVLKNVFIVADENRVQAFSTVTWQVLWEIKNNRDSNNRLLSHEPGYLFNPKKIRVAGNYLYVYEDYRNRVLKFNPGGVFLGVVLEGEDIIDIPVYKDRIHIVKDVEISTLPETANITSIDFDNYKNLYAGTDYFDEDQGSIFVLNEENRILDNIFRYKKKVEKLIIDRKNNLYVLGEKDGKNSLSIFYPEKMYNQSGEIDLSFNSTIKDCQWHRLVLDLDIPEGTSLSILIGATNDEEEDVFYESFQNAEDIYIPDSIKGQYLKVKIVFQSDSQRKRSPVLHSIKVYFSRRTYIEYLPAFYQDDPKSRDILNRFLSIFQTFDETIEREILNTPYLIDPITAKPEFLEWLSLWMGISRDENWEIDKWRAFLKNAYEFYKKRGTREGIVEILSLYTGSKPILVEPFQLKQCKAELFELYSQEKKIDEFSFCVFLKPDEKIDEKRLKIIKKIVDTWKPAYTQAKVVQMRNMILLGTFVCLEINSYLYKPHPALGFAIVPIDTVLTDIEENLQVELHSRLGIDTQIKF